jgi:hypothetical protein
MCDTGDIVDIGAGIATGGASYALKKVTGSDLPLVGAIKGAVGAGSGNDIAPPDIAPPPPPPDLTDELVRRATSAQRLRQLMQQGLGSSFLTGPMGLSMPAPTSVPGLSGS